MRWAEEQRMNFIKKRIDEKGVINRSDLIEEFKISMPQASTDLKRFQERNPKALKYNLTLKRYESRKKKSNATRSK